MADRAMSMVGVVDHGEDAGSAGEGSAYAYAYAYAYLRRGRGGRGARAVGLQLDTDFPSLPAGAAAVHGRCGATGSGSGAHLRCTDVTSIQTCIPAL
jgi:hypothetical protein